MSVLEGQRGWLGDSKGVIGTKCDSGSVEVSERTSESHQSH